MRDDRPTQRMPRYPQQPDPNGRGAWTDQHGEPTQPLMLPLQPGRPLRTGGIVRGPQPFVRDPDETFARQLPPRLPVAGRRRPEPKRPSTVLLWSAVTWAILTFGGGFVIGVLLMSVVILQQRR